MFVVNKKRFPVRHFDEYKKQLLTSQQEIYWAKFFFSVKNDAHFAFSGLIS